MKRFSVREFALLCLPVAVVAGAGFWAVRKPAPKPYVAPKFSLSYETPSALKAFEGAKIVIVAKLGDDSDGNSYELDRTKSLKYWLDVETIGDIKTWRPDGTGSLRLNDVSASRSANRWYYIYLKQVPDGNLTFGVSGTAVGAASPTKAKPHAIKQDLPVDKTKLKSFDFSLPRAPLVKIKSATISQITRPTATTVRLILILQGTEKMEKSGVETDFRERHGYANATMRAPDSNAARNIIVDEALFDPNGINQEVELTGRISAANRWPLAFALEPFDYAKAKVGQQLKFKSWPAPLPLGAKN